jgi:hypothetical protein
MALEAFQNDNADCEFDTQEVKTFVDKSRPSSKKLNPRNEAFVPKIPPKLEPVVPVPIEAPAPPTIWVDDLSLVHAGNLFN